MTPCPVPSPLATVSSTRRIVDPEAHVPGPALAAAG
jgi:hypothetical protein